MDQKGQHLDQYVQICIFWANVWPFLGQNPNFVEREQYSHIRKLTRHLVSIVFWSGRASKWTRKAKIWPKMTKNANFWPNMVVLGPKMKYWLWKKCTTLSILLVIRGKVKVQIDNFKPLQKFSLWSEKDSVTVSFQCPTFVTDDYFLK